MTHESDGTHIPQDAIRHHALDTPPLRQRDVFQRVLCAIGTLCSRLSRIVDSSSKIRHKRTTRCVLLLLLPSLARLPSMFLPSLRRRRYPRLQGRPRPRQLGPVSSATTLPSVSIAFARFPQDPHERHHPPIQLQGRVPRALCPALRGLSPAVSRAALPSALSIAPCRRLHRPLCRFSLCAALRHVSRLVTPASSLYLSAPRLSRRLWRRVPLPRVSRLLRLVCCASSVSLVLRLSFSTSLSRLSRRPVRLSHSPPLVLRLSLSSLSRLSLGAPSPPLGAPSLGLCLATRGPVRLVSRRAALCALSRDGEALCAALCALSRDAGPCEPSLMTRRPVSPLSRREALCAAM